MIDMDDDDWLISSMKRYEQLFMYELAFPILQFDWTLDHTGLWVCSAYSNGKTELNLLSLPEKLTNQCLTARRDFKIVSGVLTPVNVSCICTMDNEVLVVGNSKQCKVHMLSRDEVNSDLLVEKQVFDLPAKTSESGVSNMKWNKACPNQLLISRNKPGLIELLDINSGHVVWEWLLGDEIHGIGYHGDYPQFVTCHGPNGILTLIDPRQSLSSCSTTSVSNHNSYILSTSSSTSILTFSSGILKLYDTRSLATPTSTVTMTAIKSTTTPCVEFSAVNPHHISLSGIGKQGVYVYNTQNWNGFVEEPEAIFIHDGHEEERGGGMVLTHKWHPSINRLVISAGSDGSLHAWQFNE